ncbi:MAG: PD-(D/E)XK nuclease family protein, partial [Gammaproteobacteria bacterium]|nr:PD-(D/E)XK nuclease family protein [Gammaproteobacteria bacterium]
VSPGRALFVDEDQRQFPPALAAEVKTLSQPLPCRFRFPAGRDSGHFLHALLEQCDFTLSEERDFDTLVEAKLEQFGFAAEWQEGITAWMREVIHTPLAADGSSALAEIANSQKRVEMEFQFPLHGLEATAVNRLMAELRAEWGQPPPQLSFATISGMMKGFIDLVFLYEGRYYLLDYKSNHLGAGEEAYRPHHLAAAMSQHHYDLQMMIYTVALQRYLQLRIPDYSYATHFGGSYYLFLRGMWSDVGAERGVYFYRPEEAQWRAFATVLTGEAW